MKNNVFTRLLLPLALMGSVALVSVHCENANAFSKPPKPSELQAPSPTPAPPKAETPPDVTVDDGDEAVAKAPQPANSAAALSSITDLAARSKCAAYQWKNRGSMPKGKVKGVALVYARAVCNPDWPINKIIAAPIGKDTAQDGLAWYAMPQGDSTLQTYTMLLGLTMRESSGKYCCGRDMSANFSSADSAEAGGEQTSYGARSSASPELYNLFVGYSSPDAQKCFLDVYKEGVGTCSDGNLKNWGTGDGFKWQALTKACPAFADEYAAVLIRRHGGTKGEFGPMRAKAAEYRYECESLLTQVKQIVKSSPGICGLL